LIASDNKPLYSVAMPRHKDRVGMKISQIYAMLWGSCPEHILVDVSVENAKGEDVDFPIITLNLK
jgi:hypothetical protein